MFRTFVLFLLLFTQNVSAQTMLILGDSLSAGYRMPIEQSWPSLIEPKLQASSKISRVINASISGDTTGNGLARLPSLLKTYSPDWVFIELGANDGLRGFPPKKIRNNLELLIKMSQESGAKVMLMQIQIPLNYGKRYSKSFTDIYPSLSHKHHAPLIPFFMEKIFTTDGWLMSDGLHPEAIAQPWIAEFVKEHITPYIK